MIGALCGPNIRRRLLVSPIALRACLLASAAAGLTACASNPPGREGPAPIDFRVASPKVHTPTEPVVMAAPRAPAAVAPAPVAPSRSSNPEIVQRVVDVGVSPTGTSAIEEAKGMTAEAGYRPGGTMRQARDNPSAREIEVQSGDTLYDISRRYSVNMRALIETNGLEPPYALDKGDVVYLPPPNVHVVEKGETLYSVSRRYNVDTRSLALLNNMQRPWTVYVGDELQLPPLAREQAREVIKPAQVTAPVTLAAAPVAKPATVKTPVSKPVDEKPVSLVGDKTTAAAKPAPKPVIEPPPPPKSTPSTPAGARDFIWPISGNVLKGFGSGADGIRNDGVNIAAAPGADVRAAAGGKASPIFMMASTPRPPATG